MDKRLDFTGGNPDIRIDQILIDAEANRPALFAILQSYAVGTNPNFIISGCEFTIGGTAPNNTFDITEGYIFLNDEIVQVEAQSGTYDFLTEVVVYSKVVTYNPKGDITYNDATPRQTWQENRGVVTVQSSVAITELSVQGDRINDKLAIYLDLPTTGSWQAPSYNAGFSGDIGNPFAYRLSNGKLEFRGGIVSTTTNTDSAFTLPVDHRPSEDAHQNFVISGTGADSDSFVVYTDGTVRAFSWSSGGNTNYFNNIIIID